MPGVAHREARAGTSPRPAGSALDRATTTSPSLGELDRVREQVEQHLPQAGRVADDRRRARPSSIRQPSSRPFSAGARRDDVERALDALAQVERLALELELAGLDLREVEDVVDHVQQRVAARADDLGELALLAGRARCRAAGRSCRSRRSSASGSRGSSSPGRRSSPASPPRPPAGPLELGDVVVDAEEADVRAVDHERDEHQLDVDRRAVLPPARCVIRCARPTAMRLLRDLAPLVAIARRRRRGRRSGGRAPLRPNSRRAPPPPGSSRSPARRRPSRPPLRD